MTDSDLLKAYKDTGLKPEDIKKVFNEEAVLKLAGQYLGTTPEDLRNLAQAEKDGRLVVLPCKVGDRIYAIKRYGGKPLCIVDDVVRMIGFTSRSVHVSLRRNQDHGKTYIYGKNAFSTYEEAEAARKGDIEDVD